MLPMTPGRASPLVDRVFEVIRRHDLFDPAGERVVVATSGGADSVALLLALHDLAGSGRLSLEMTVAHLNHGLRGEAAEADEAFVRALAERLDLPHEVGRADVAAGAARAAGVGLEEAGREARRRFLAAVAADAGARKVALAHHADDQAETVLFHALRGTGVEGLAAMRPRAPLEPDAGVDIVRPMLELSRGEIVVFLRERGEAWREDATNASAAHTRNRLRHEVLPLVAEAVNPRVTGALARLADQAAAASEVLGDALDDAWARWVREVPGKTAPGAIFLVDAEGFAALRPWLRGALLRRAVERLGGGLKHMSADRTREAARALLAKPVAGPVKLPGGLVAVRRREAIRIGRPFPGPRS